ncbi:GMC family oxidoreductase [Niveispirillum sp. KHB5.9]|uniref:GMC family oxidoreductase n=1 Tax=Niveispirillum sp. KHB5.9 TaxID=3400269 RepID=UPI003A89193A
MQGYDYIVVGAGSAGCALAARLSQDPAARVLLLEAGHRPRGWMRDMPAAIKQTMQRADLDWGFKSEPEPGLNGRQLALLRGKTVGGCSQINGMMYARGHPTDYDDWAALGNRGWSYRDVLPYFRRLEDSWAGEGAFHGTGGPLGVSRPKEAALMMDRFRRATQAAGYPGSDDYHSDPVEGFTPIELTVARGRRANTGSAYLAPVLSRPNLTLLTGAHLARVVIERGRATGVEFIKDGQREKVAATGEVILSGGTYGSAQMLMLSGVGPARSLAAAGVKTIHDAPEVGRNLVEHPMFYMQFAASGGTFRDQLRLDRALVSVLRWALAGDGPFATNACAGNIYLKTERGLDRPDIQLGLPTLAMGSGIWTPWSRTKPPHGLSVGVIGLYQDSRGMVELRSSEPLAAPRIQLNLMTQAADIRRMIAGIRQTRAIYAQTPLAEILLKELSPGADTASDAELEAALRATCATAHHPVGTCRMGTDAGAVVDPALRVRGVERLRVADAAIMPTIVGGNTNVPAIMIGEKAADLIRFGEQYHTDAA